MRSLLLCPRYVFVVLFRPVAAKHYVNWRPSGHGKERWAIVRSQYGFCLSSLLKKWWELQLGRLPWKRSRASVVIQVVSRTPLILKELTERADPVLFLLAPLIIGYVNVMMPACQWGGNRTLPIIFLCRSLPSRAQ